MREVTHNYIVLYSQRCHAASRSPSLSRHRLMEPALACRGAQPTALPLRATLARQSCTIGAEGYSCYACEQRAPCPWWVPPCECRAGSAGARAPRAPYSAQGRESAWWCNGTVTLSARPSCARSSTTWKSNSGKNPLERADVRKARLQQVDSDERCEEIPCRVSQVTKRERSENECAGKPANDVILTHGVAPSDGIVRERVRPLEAAFCRQHGDVYAFAHKHLIRQRRDSPRMGSAGDGHEHLPQ